MRGLGRLQVASSSRVDLQNAENHERPWAKFGAGPRVCDPQRVREAGRDRVGLKRPDVRACCGSIEPRSANGTERGVCDVCDPQRVRQAGRDRVGLSGLMFGRAAAQ